MDELLPPSARSSLMKRAQKIRQRMMLEMASGVPVTDKERFLSACLQYERDASEGSLSMYGSACKESFDIEDIQRIPYWDSQRFDAWKDWTDWHDYSRSVRKTAVK